MTNSDNQVLAALEYAARQDGRVQRDIKRAIASHDRDFFAQVVFRVMAQLRLTVADTRRFIDSAYEWFINRQ